MWAVACHPFGMISTAELDPDGLEEKTDFILLFTDGPVLELFGAEIEGVGRISLTTTENN